MTIPSTIRFSRPDGDKGWRAEIQLKYGAKSGKTRLLERFAVGPLAVQKTFYPEGETCHTYLLHPPGGVVGGDQLRFDIQVDTGSHALLTTPGATKFYRSHGDTAWQSQELTAVDGAFLEWLPMENIFFPGAEVKLITDVKLEGNARFIGWEMQCFGRPVLEEEFSHGQILGQTHIFRDGKLLLAENIRLQNQTQLDYAAALRGYPMTGSLYISPVDDALVERITQLIDEQQTRFGEAVLLGASELEGLLVVRALGQHTEPMMASFVQIWSAVRKSWLGCTPDAPRIWST